MPTRVTALALVASIAISGGVADAATKHKVVKPPKPVCNLVTDPASDSGPLAPEGQTSGPGYDSSLDIVSADVASDAKNVTAVVRVKQLAPNTSTSPDPNSPLGREWRFNLVIGGHSYGLAAFDGPLGPNFTTGTNGGVIDTAHNEIRITEPISAMPFGVPKNTVMNSFDITAYSALQLDSAAGFGDATPLSKEDEATGKATTKYLAWAPSCVKVGK